MTKELFSVSRINTFLENPWKHWCKYIAGYKEKYDPERNKYMDRGTVFHKGVELMAQGKEPSEAIALAVAYGHEQGFVQEAKDSGKIAIERYLKEYGTEPFTNTLETEKRYELDINSQASFTGIVDAVVDNMDGTITLVDYKTYSNAPQADKLMYSVQANIYLYVVNALGYKATKFVFDCVNPKEVLKGRAYCTKRIEFDYNEARATHFWDSFCKAVDIIQSNPEYNLYKSGDYMPDAYDYLYKVYVGDINEDLDDYIEKHFDIKETLYDELD